MAPLLVSARSLRELSSDTASLRDREFAATLILGRMRASAQEVSQRTELLTLFPSDTTRSAFLARLTTLEAGADTLQHLTGSAGLLRIRTTLDALREATPSVYELARQGRTAQADSLVDKVMRPAIADVQRMLEVTEATLERIARFFVWFLKEVDRAPRERINPAAPPR